METGVWLSSAFKSRDYDVSFQTTHQLKIEPKKLRYSGRCAGRGEGDKQNDGAWNARQATSELSGTNHLGKDVPILI